MIVSQFSITDSILDNIVLMLSEKTGNNFRETHKNGILRYVEKRTEELNVSIKEYEKLLEEDECEIKSLINASTVNETYFFREEKQFDLLKRLLQSKDKPCIWSAASSSGEEIYSIKLICDSLNIETDLFASDINTEKLKILNKGEYNINQSTRTLDGKKYHDLLKPYINQDEVLFPQELKNGIKSMNINLVDFDSYKVLGQRKFDIIFLRNIFIYLSVEQRYKILRFIEENYLKEDGYIFVSISEIAQIEEKKVSEKIEKECIDNVFVLHKKIEKNVEVHNE